MCKVDADLVIWLGDMLGGATIDFLVQRGVSREDAGAFADKVQWQIEGLLDYVE